MQNFSEQLIAARKAQGMTQEKLAEVMEVSRPMISHWENGRAQPDVESLRRLSQLLHYDFLQGQALSENAQQEQAPENSPAASQKRRGWGYVLAFVCGVLLTLSVQFALIPLLTSAPKSTPQSDYPEDAYSVAWYKEPGEPVPGQAYIAIHTAENPIKAAPIADFGGDPGWRFTYFMEETNGVAFTVEELTHTRFSEEGSANVLSYTGEDIKAAWGNNAIPAGGKATRGGGTRLQPLVGEGLLIRGTDANGNKLEFHYFLEFSQELADE